MKLRNNKTGEIVVFGEGIVDLTVIGCKNVSEMINAGWEDYEEPKEYWYVTCDGRVEKGEYDYNKSHIIGHLSINNYFGSKEEAEKAVEKLNALKRLEAKGFRFFGNVTLGEYGNAKYRLDYPVTTVEKADLDLLFGGEE